MMPSISSMDDELDEPGLFALAVYQAVMTLNAWPVHTLDVDIEVSKLCNPDMSLKSRHLLLLMLTVQLELADLPVPASASHYLTSYPYPKEIK